MGNLAYEISKSKLVEAQQYLAGGVASSLRRSMRPTPLYVEAASGSRIRDVDRNEYIDYLLAYGPLILGHAHPTLTESVHQAMQRGYTYGLQHDGEIELAERLTEILPCVDKVSFSGSGTEAVMLAIRLARAYTGRQKVIRFHGHFHGWADTIFTSFPSPDMKQDEAKESGTTPPGTKGQSENSLEDIIVVRWNDSDALKKALETHQDEIAAVITEPVMCNNGCITPLPGYMEKMREWTAEMGIVLIFDEVITGFRVNGLSAHNKFGILPDLMTMGKGMAGGIQMSAVGGKADIMKLIDDGDVNHLGTLNGNTVATSAALAVIEELTRNNGEALAHMEALVDHLVTGIRDLLTKHRIPGQVNRFGAAFHLMFIEQESVTDFDTFNLRDAEKYLQFAERMLGEGVLVRPSGLWYVSAAHQEDDVSETLNAVDRVLAKL